MTEHIRIGDVRPRIQYVGDGTRTAFSYPFPVFRAADLHVYVGESRLGSGYTVAGAGTSEGGTVTFVSAPADGARVTLLRHLDIARVTDFQAGGPLRAATLNDELDHLTAVDQQLAETLSRAVTLSPAADEAVAMALPAPLPGAVLGWNQTGSALVNDPLDYAGLAADLASMRDGVPAAVQAAAEAEQWARDAALSAWLVGLNEDGAGSAVATAVNAAADAAAAAMRAETWAEDAALTAWRGTLEDGDGGGGDIPGPGDDVTYASLTTSGDASIGSALQVDGNATITGDLLVSGTTVTVDAETTLVADNMVTLNHGEVGAGVTAGVSGVDVDRGTETAYRFLFRESDDSFRIGESGSEQAVATRQDSPTDGALAYWNDAQVRLDSVPGLTWDGSALTLPGDARYTAARFAVGSASVGASHTVDLADGEVQALTLGDDTVVTLPDPPAGHGYSVTLKLIQDATGSRAPSFQQADTTAARWLGGSAPTWKTADGEFDVVVLTHDGTDLTAAHAGGVA